MSRPGDSASSAPDNARTPPPEVPHVALQQGPARWLEVAARFVPIARWLPNYNRDDFPGDITAGIIVAIMLLPQSMAYAMLAGLPPQAGLYASIVPLTLYAMFGSSRALAVGPVAIVCLMISSALTPLAQPGSAEYIALALALALLSGLFLVALGILRAGFVVNFLSHPVLAGFTTAAAIVIGVSQLKDLLGIPLANANFLPSVLWSALKNVPSANIATVLIGTGSVAALVYRSELTAWLKARGLAPGVIGTHLAKAMPLAIVVAFTLLTAILQLSSWAGVKIVGAIPYGLPPLTLPPLAPSALQTVIMPAILISLIGFLESVSVAKSLASKRRQTIDPNQELIGLGAANIGAAFTGGFPVTGGFSRSVVNFTAGANTQLATLLTAALIFISLLALTPLLYFLPRAVLSAIVVVAVTNLIDIHAFKQAWRYSKIDGLGYLGTFAAVLTLGVDMGILIGIAISLLLHLWRTSTPHIAIVGRVGRTEHFRNVRRHAVTTYDNLLLMRIDESLYFANAAYLEQQVLTRVAADTHIKHFVLICNAVNLIDASALDSLEKLIESLREMGITMHLAEIKGPVMDRLHRTDILDKLLPGRVFLSTHEAVSELAAETLSPPPPATPATLRTLDPVT